MCKPLQSVILAYKIMCKSLIFFGFYLKIYIIEIVNLEWIIRHPFNIAG